MDDTMKELEKESAEKSTRHHHHHSRKKKSKSKFVRFLKKNRSAAINVVIIVLAIAAVVSMGIWGDNRRDSETVTPKDPVNEVVVRTDDNTLQIDVPFFTEEVQIASNPAVAFVRSNLSYSGPEFFSRYRTNGERLDVGLPVTLKFDVSRIPVEHAVVSSTVEISESDSFVNSRVFRLKSDERSVRVYHLKVDTQYYYRISINLSNNSVTSVQSSFHTAESPRIISIDGAVNVRDIGGWKTLDGKTVRQGLLYRGSELDGAVEKEFCISEKGKNDMLTVLGISMDMDLRASTDNTYGTDALGANVKHIYYNAPMYSGIFQNHEAVRKIFSDLANKDNYPVYLHCTYGMDRTGTMCYLLEALLGVSEDDLMRDYHLTALYYSTLNSDAMDAFVADFKALDGTTMQEKAERYLLSVGITEDEIESIREIFLE